MLKLNGILGIRVGKKDGKKEKDVDNSVWCGL